VKFALLVVWQIDTLRSRASWRAFYAAPLELNLGVYLFLLIYRSYRS